MEKEFEAFFFHSLKLKRCVQLQLERNGDSAAWPWNRQISNSCRRSLLHSQNRQNHSPEHAHFLSVVSLQLIVPLQLSWAAVTLCVSSNLSASQTTSLSLPGPPFCHCLISHCSPFSLLRWNHRVTGTSPSMM